MIKIVQCVSYFPVWTSKWTKMTTNCDVLTHYVIKIWERISDQSSKSPKPKQSVPTHCCLKVSPYTCVYKHSDARIWFGFEGTGTNDFGDLHHACESNHRHSCHIKQKKVCFIASYISARKKKRKKKGGKGKQAWRSTATAEFIIHTKKYPEPQSGANLIREE